jgi:hypothetical protein
LGQTEALAVKVTGVPTAACDGGAEDTDTNAQDVKGPTVNDQV